MSPIHQFQVETTLDPGPKSYPDVSKRSRNSHNTIFDSTNSSVLYPNFVKYLPERGSMVKGVPFAFAFWNQI